ncbi:MAG TPA: type II toxin-antitoxin system death-on-curing family toxin [Gemmatimonadaceae bacterium]|nr:type II toxin-antitoxin system death-on-curing family toxin [Gemmatimonadaceae bacterium]
MTEPVWIPIATLHLLHDRQLELFGGLRGVRDEGAIESALARPVNAWTYGQAADLEALAATYLCALARQQGHLDGNKRSALAAMLVFLKINGRRLEAPGAELYAIVISAATNEIGIDQVAAWIRAHV